MESDFGDEIRLPCEVLGLDCWTAAKRKHLIGDLPCADRGATSLVFRLAGRLFSSVYRNALASYSRTTSSSTCRDVIASFTPQRRRHVACMLLWFFVHISASVLRICKSMCSILACLLTTLKSGFQFRLDGPPPACCPPPLQPSTGCKWSSPHSSPDNLF